MSKANTAVKHMLTEGDNETFDLFRVVFALAMIVFFIAFGYLMYQGKTDLAEFANAFLQLFGGGAAGTGVKSRLEGLSYQRHVMTAMPINQPQVPEPNEIQQSTPTTPAMPQRMPGQIPTRG
jgi:hypothetical protein